MYITFEALTKRKIIKINICAGNEFLLISCKIELMSRLCEKKYEHIICYCQVRHFRGRFIFALVAVSQTLNL